MEIPVIMEIRDPFPRTFVDKDGDRWIMGYLVTEKTKVVINLENGMVYKDYRIINLSE